MFQILPPSTRRPRGAVRCLALAVWMLSTPTGCDDAESTPSATDQGADARAPTDAGRDGAPADANPDSGPQLDAGADAAPGADTGLDAAADANAAPDAAVCGDDAPVCSPRTRLVGCTTCVSLLDRRCVTHADCRPGERCTEQGADRVCWFEPPPPRVCPGAPGCGDGSGDGTGPLLAGAARRVITPDGFETPAPGGLDGIHLNFVGAFTPEQWNDCGLDGLCPGDPGYPGPDEGEGDGELQGAWLAGFRHGRPAQYCPPERIGCAEPECCVSRLAHDDLLVNVVALRVGGLTVALASLDVVGFFHSDIERIRARLAPEWGVDLLVIASTHNHEAPDTVGQWGPGTGAPSRTGREAFYIDKIHEQTVAAVGEAVADLRPATAHAGIIHVGVEGLAVSDSRTPYIFDDRVPILHLRDATDGATIATALSFGNHPEVLWSGNTLITSDYPHFVRAHIERGLAAVPDDVGGERKPALPGVGGVTVFFAGALGGLINPGRGEARGYDDALALPPHSFAAANAVGERLASHVLTAIHSGALTPLEAPTLRFGQAWFLTPVTNPLFQLGAFALDLFDREVYNVTGNYGRFRPGPPQVLSEVAVVRLGEVSLFTAPGEVFPETLVGGYPGRYAVGAAVIGDVQGHRVAPECTPDGLPTEPPGQGAHPCVIRPNATHPPDWSAAPEGPYVYERVPGRFPFFIGLGNDFLGYMVPEYDYVPGTLTGGAPGDHYEETNGSSGENDADWQRNLDLLLEALR